MSINMFRFLLKCRFAQFVLGLCAGLSISLVLHAHRYLPTRDTLHPTQAQLQHEQHHGSHSSHAVINDANRAVSGDEAIHKLLDRQADGPVVEVEEKFKDEHVHHDDDSVAQDLFKRVRVLCWVLTAPQNLEKKTIHVKKTWGTRCNVNLYISSVTNDSFPTVGLNVSEGREHLTAKTMQAFQYIYDNHFDDADWFMKADDDTYVIVENLRYFLSEKNPKEPVYFGHRFKPYIKQGSPYASGRGGYVLSKEALRRYGEIGSKDPAVCAEDKGPEDLQMGRCLANLGVRLESSDDALGRSRFHCFHPDSMMRGEFPDWYFRYDWDGGRKGYQNISDYAISFHYVFPGQMYILEFYTYHLRPYGILHTSQKLNV